MNENIIKNSPTINNLLLLIDGSSYLHRAFHALPPLTNSKGEPTGAIYGVINMLRRLLTEYNPSHVAVIFDAKGKNFRHDLHHEYKATRPPLADDLRSQIEPIHDIISAMGLPILSVAGVEADDVIAALAKNASDKKMRVLVVTSDKDLAQIVNPSVTLVDTMSNKYLDEKGVEEKFGVTPDQIVAYLALVGDSSDNIPGIPGVGPKTAAKWLQTYKTLENVIANAEKIEGKVGENLRQNLDRLPLNKKLVTVQDDMLLAVHLSDLIKHAENTPKLIELFRRFEFQSWLKPLLEAEAEASQNAPSSVHCAALLNEHAFFIWLGRLEKAPYFVINALVDNIDPMQAELIGLAFTDQEGYGAYLPLKHNYEDAPDQLPVKEVISSLQPLLENNKKIKVGQNLKQTYHALANLGIKLGGIGFDTTLESYLLNSSAAHHDLETLALKYLGIKAKTLKNAEGKVVKTIKFSESDVEKTISSAASNADLTLRLHKTLWQQIRETGKLASVFQEIDMPLLGVLARMERNGVKLDLHLLKKQSAELAARITHLEKETYKIAGQTFNLNSPKQLQEILFTKLGLPITEKTPTGQPSTGESVLQDLALTYPLPKLILEYRTLSKLKSTYVDSLPLQVNPTTGRIHTSFNQTITSTGRLSSSDPNLQNIPIRSAEGRRVRQAFIAPKGYKILSIDYSQIELRIMAHLSEDPGLLKAFAEDEDIHRATAAEIFSLPLDKVTPEERRSAKAINFGLIYGMSSFGLAKQIGVDKNTAQDYINLYFARYPGVKKFMESTRESAKKHGFVETLYGRRIYVPEIKAQNFQRRAAAERAAINAPLQGTAADIMKVAMIKIDQWILESKLDIKMLLQVHDELVFEIAADHIADAQKKITQFMQDAIQLKVPVIAHAGIGDNWDEAH